MIQHPYSAVAILLLLAGCSTGNIKGDFQCAAPGGTCAPMSSIDAAAISSIGGFRAVGQPGIESQRVPHGLAGPVLADGSPPARTSDRVLRVVFPAHIDADGIYREQSAAHAVVEDSAWTAALAGETGKGRGTPGLRSAGIVPTSAPVAAAPTSALATLDEIIAARAAQARGGADTAAASFGATATVGATPDAMVPVAAAPVAAAPASFASRSAVPGSLAEAASGLSAPRVTSLDPRAPPDNYDRPDVVAIASQDPSQPSAVAARASSASTAGNRAAAATTASISDAAPYGTRPVRWKGKTYDLPYKAPQTRPYAAIETPESSVSPGTGSSASAEPAPAQTTASLNRTSLAKAGEAPRPPAVASAPPPNVSYGVTSDASIAQARVRSMALPIMQSAADSGREAARAAAPEGLALPLTALKDAPR